MNLVVYPIAIISSVTGCAEEPGRSAIAFRLFGRSIGAARSMQSTIKVTAFVLLAIVLFVMYQRHCAFSLIAMSALVIPLLWFTRHYNTVIMKPRDVTTWAFLLAVLWLQWESQRAVENKTAVGLGLIAALSAFIPLTSFAYSIDRGFYLTATYLVVCPLTCLVIPTRRLRLHYLFFSFCGAAVAILTVRWLMGDGFSAFLEYTFVVLPKYKELGDGLIYPIREPAFLAISALAAQMRFGCFSGFSIAGLLRQDT